MSQEHHHTDFLCPKDTGVEYLAKIPIIAHALQILCCNNYGAVDKIAKISLKFTLQWKKKKRKSRRNLKKRTCRSTKPPEFIMIVWLTWFMLTCIKSIILCMSDKMILPMIIIFLSSFFHYRLRTQVSKTVWPFPRSQVMWLHSVLFPLNYKSYGRCFG